jgi:hypothetical protein
VSASRKQEVSQRVSFLLFALQPSSRNELASFLSQNYCNKPQTTLSLRSFWRDGRVVEGARLESVYTATYRGFEPLSLRQTQV